MRLSIVGYRLAITVDNDGRVIILGIGWPVESWVDFFGVANDDSAVMLESSSPRP